MTVMGEVPQQWQGPAAVFQARARAAGTEVPQRQVRGPLAVDLERYEVTLDGRRVALSPRQVEVLALFLADPARVWSREQLHAICWGSEARSRRVDVQLCRIRGRLGREVFRNVRDRGWALL